jgi:hypothetical protein
MTPSLILPQGRRDQFERNQCECEYECECESESECECGCESECECGCEFGCESECECECECETERAVSFAVKINSSNHCGRSALVNECFVDDPFAFA